MTTPMPTARTYLGVALETTYGTPVAPSMTIPLKTFSPTDNVVMLDDVGVRGSMIQQYGSVPGPSWTMYDFSGDAYPDSLPWWLGSLLPDVTTTGGGPFSHVFSTLNTGTGQAKGRTITDYSGLGATSGARRFPGAVVTDLNLKFNADGLLEYDGKTLAMPSTLFPTSAPTKTLGTLVPTPAYIPTITIGGSAVGSVQDGNFQLQRTGKPLITADGTQAPIVQFAGPIKGSGAFTFIAADETELLRYLNNTQPTLDINFGSTINASTQMKLHSTKCIYKASVLDRSQDYTTYKVTFETHGNTTDVGTSGGFGIVQATVQNALPAGTYA